MTTQTTSSACPHLGLAGDPTVMFAAPTAAHRCYALAKQPTPNVEHQTDFCLSQSYPHCPYYSEVTPVIEEQTTNNVKSKSFRLIAGAMTVALLLVFLLFIVGARFLQRSGISNIQELIPTNAESAVGNGTTDGQRSLDSVSSTGIMTSTEISTTQSSTQLSVTQSSSISTAVDTLQETATSTPRVHTSTPTPSPQIAGKSETEASGPIATPGSTRFFTPTPEPGGQVLYLSPKNGDASWWLSGGERRNYVGDSFLYAGRYEEQVYLSAMRFDVGRIPRGAPIRQATLRLTGLRADRFDSDIKGTWLIQLIAEDTLESLTLTDYLAMSSASTTFTLFPPVDSSELGVKKVNSRNFDEAARKWLEQQRIDGATSIFVRILASTDGETLFAWDSGMGQETVGDAPGLLINLGPPPPTPPPTPTGRILIATLTATPANVLTAVAHEELATSQAVLAQTETPIFYEVVTPTPFPKNLETVQAMAVDRGYAPIVLHTPTPANVATADANTLYATAIARTTGTFTPEPEDYVTPVLVIPSPPPQNVATAAARSIIATEQVRSGLLESTPLPHNAVIAEFVIATKTPLNNATAESQVLLATAAAETTGTPTPMPWHAVVITLVPTPGAPPTPVNLGNGGGTTSGTASGTTGETITQATPTSTPTIAPVCAGTTNVIQQPGNYQEVSGVIGIIGSANHENFAYYKMEVAPGVNATDGFAFLLSREQPVLAGGLGGFDTTTVPDGLYTLRLTVVDNTGNYPQPCEITIGVKNQE